MEVYEGYTNQRLADLVRRIALDSRIVNRANRTAILVEAAERLDELDSE